MAFWAEKRIFRIQKGKISHYKGGETLYCAEEEMLNLSKRNFIKLHNTVLLRLEGEYLPRFSTVLRFYETEMTVLGSEY